MKKMDLVVRLLLAFVAFSSGIFDFVAPPPLIHSFQSIQLPLYYLPYFGALKVAGALGLLSPWVLKTDVLRMGAQWGLLFYFSGAGITHLLANDAAHAPVPLLLGVFALVSLVLFLRTPSADAPAVGPARHAALA